MQRNSARSTAGLGCLRSSVLITRSEDFKLAKALKIDRVSIRPGVSILSVLSHLNYRPWFALAEFVDNAIQSHLTYQAELVAVDGPSQLKVSIDIDATDGGRITVRDNAAGISAGDFPRAFRPAQLPPDRSGLSEFGMGMKSAACWFAPRWHVRTSALGEPIERTVRFNIDEIIQDSLDELQVHSVTCSPESHFTEIALVGLHQLPIGRTLGKIRSHLTEIYRIFVRERILELRLNGEELRYEEPEILVAPSYRNESGSPIEWKKEFDFDFGVGLRAHGFAAIRKRASVSGAGFALFRRNRLIQGSGDEGYRPEYIFGKPNTFPFQRVFGEIHLQGFEVSHTKDGFQWDENEQPFLDLLRDVLTGDDMPLLQQAREYRVERAREDYRKGAEQAAERTSRTIEQHVAPVLSELAQRPDAPEPAPDLRQAELASHRVIDVHFGGQPWRIVLELSVDPSVGEWLEISEQIARDVAGGEDVGRRLIGLRLSLIHPFMQRFCGTGAEEIEPLLRIAAALGLAEFAARDSGAKKAGAVRRNINELLRTAFSRT